MKYYLICPIEVIGGKEELLTYQHEENLEIGEVVKIPFGKKVILGIAMQATQKPLFKTKPIVSRINVKISEQLLLLAKWMSQYYAVRISQVIPLMLPAGIEKKRRILQTPKPETNVPTKLPSLTADQQKALKTIIDSSSITTLLHGVTGAGKTLIYQKLALKALKNNRSVVLLVPEIALTPQLAAQFNSLHKNVVVLHSNLSESKRHQLWQQINESTEPWIIIGPRSALFSPINSIGLIVIDESHEPSYQQENQPKYSALRVARKLAELHNAKLILGSATPLISDYYFAEQTKTPIVELPNTVKKMSLNVQLVDMRKRELFNKHHIFSRPLLEALESTLKNGKQSMLFYNRRGTARTSLCSNCGWVGECPNCHIPLRLHHDKHQLRCHVCTYHQSIPPSCPICDYPSIDFKGFGSKRIEQEVIKLFPEAKVVRFDSDTPEKEQLHHKYNDLLEGKIDIIIGTQGIAKGLDLPNLDTVGIVQADTELFIPDFSSTERSFQLTTQVIGRVGRVGQAAQVIIQTFNPEHPAILFAKNQDYKNFYEYELKERKLAHFTPFTFMLQLITGYASADAAEKTAVKFKEQIKKQHPNVYVRGPEPAFHEHRGKLFYQQLIVTSQKRSDLVAIAKNLPARWQFMLDPINLL